MKNANTANVLTFAPDALTVNGRTFPASYSLARTGDVYVFATVPGEAADLPVRLHISATMPMHAEAVAAAEAARKASKPAALEAPAPVQEVAPAPVEPAPVQDAPADKPAPAKKPRRKAAKAETVSASVAAPVEPAPVQDAPVDKPAPAKKPRRKASKPAAQEAPAPVQEVAPAPVEPAPVQDAPAQEAAPAGKAWIGTQLTGKGWTIAFDAAAGRTRVQVEGTPTDAQRNAIEQAGFYWSAQLQSWNKKLTCKAYRAAQALACTLNALA